MGMGKELGVGSCAQFKDFFCTFKVQNVYDWFFPSATLVPRISDTLYNAVLAKA
jgi:hypothetical protein